MTPSLLMPFPSSSGTQGDVLLVGSVAGTNIGGSSLTVVGATANENY